MPYVARNRSTGERIDITTFHSPREALESATLECRLCKVQMFIRRSPRGKFHFFHQRSCTTDYLYHPETPEHLAGKSFVAKYFLPKLSEYADFNHLFEEPLQVVKRVADIIIKFPMGWWVANEIQLSSITPEELEARTRDYLNAGVDALWWLGKSADTNQNRQWAIKKYGFSPFLIFEDEEVVAYGYCEYRSEMDEYGIPQLAIQTHKHSPAEESQASFAWPHLVRKVGEWWVELAFARYDQVWREGNNERYHRGLFAKESTIRSFAGRVGAGNKSRFRKMNDNWCVNEQQFLFFLKKQGISILSEETVRIIKQKAKNHQLSRANTSLQPTQNPRG